MFYDIEEIRRCSPSVGKIMVYWLGAAGFCFRFDEGEIICIDPYLTDSVERIYGAFRRLSLAPIKPSELQFDVLLLTHDHGDHLDVDGINSMLKANPSHSILASTPCKKFLNEQNIVFDLVSQGSIKHFGNVTIEVVPADHGELCPCAIGFFIKYSGRQIYFTGDTSYNQDMLQNMIAKQPEILIPCINGAYGNLTEREASLLAAKCNSKIVIPSHFGLCVEHGGCPRRFSESLKIEAPDANLIVLTPGRGLEI